LSCGGKQLILKRTLSNRKTDSGVIVPSEYFFNKDQITMDEYRAKLLDTGLFISTLCQNTIILQNRLDEILPRQGGGSSFLT
jgi:hypothetical protein